MQLKIRMSKEEFLDAVTADDLVDTDALTFTNQDNILVVDGDVVEIEACLGELQNCYSKADLKHMIV